MGEPEETSFSHAGIPSHIRVAGIYFLSFYLDECLVWPQSHSVRQTKGVFVCISESFINSLALKIHSWDKSERVAMVLNSQRLREKSGLTSLFPNYLVSSQRTLYFRIRQHWLKMQLKIPIKYCDQNEPSNVACRSGFQGRWPWALLVICPVICNITGSFPHVFLNSLTCKMRQ